jgi:hypothetical protein
VALARNRAGTSYIMDMELKILGHLAAALFVGAGIAAAQNRPPELASPNPPGRIYTAPEPRHWEFSRAAAGPVHATGTAELEPATNGAAGPRTLALNIQGLGIGNYVVEAVTRPKGEFIELGQLAVRDPAAGPEIRAGEARKEVANGQQSDLLSVRTELTLPADLKPADIERLVITDTGGLVQLTGKLQR